MKQLNKKTFLIYSEPIFKIFIIHIQVQFQYTALGLNYVDFGTLFFASLKKED